MSKQLDIVVQCTGSFLFVRFSRHHNLYGHIGVQRNTELEATLKQKLGKLVTILCLPLNLTGRYVPQGEQARRRLQVRGFMYCNYNKQLSTSTRLTVSFLCSLCVFHSPIVCSFLVFSRLFLIVVDAGSAAAAAAAAAATAAAAVLLLLLLLLLLVSLLLLLLLVVVVVMVVCWLDG